MSVARNQIVEALVGLVVVVAAVLMVVFFLDRTGGGGGDEPIEVTALFPNASGIDVGTDVRVAGLSIGRVTGMSLDPEGFQAEVHMAIDPTANLPQDSSAAITSEGLLGGSYISMLPGGSPDKLADGDLILDTQGAVDMLGLVGSMINDSGGDSGGGFDTMSEESDGFDTMDEELDAAAGEMTP